MGWTAPSDRSRQANNENDASPMAMDRESPHQPDCGSLALISNWAAKARLYAGRASLRAT